MKKIYRIYGQELLLSLSHRGFADLRPSFLEVLLVICEKEAPTIKEVGVACGLKKQTMTSHLNELEKRDYIIRKINPSDKREQLLYLTPNGEKFKVALLASVAEIEKKYIDIFGQVELDRIEKILTNFYSKLN